MQWTPIKRRSGQSSSEYAIIIGLTAILIIVVLAVLGVSLSAVYCSILGVFGSKSPQCDSGVLLSDGFDSLAGWTFTQGSGWSNQGGKLVVEQGGEHRGFTGNSSWTDYTVRVQQSTLGEGNGYGVYFRISNEPAINGYVFQYDPGYGAFLIRKVINGNETPPIGVSVAPPNFQWTNTTRAISIDVRGNNFTASVDNQVVVRATDSQFPNGRVGLRTWDSSRATFDNLTVSK